MQAAPEARGCSFGRVWEKRHAGRMRRRAIEELARLDDRMLHDIGIERALIPEVVAAMACHGSAAPGTGPSSGAKAKGAGRSFLRRMAKGLTRAWIRRQAIGGLSRLDDRLLRDIGIERGRIPETVDAMLESEPAPPRGATVHELVVKARDTEEPGPTPALAA